MDKLSMDKLSMDKLSMDKLSMDKEIKLHEAGCRSYLTALPVRPGFIRMSMLLPADVSVLSGWLRMYIAGCILNGYFSIQLSYLLQSKKRLL